MIGYRTSRKGCLYSAHYRTRGKRGQIDIKNKWSSYVYGPFRELKKIAFLFLSLFLACVPCSIVKLTHVSVTNSLICFWKMHFKFRFQTYK